MKLTRLIGGIVIFAVVAGLAYVAQQNEPTASKMASAAERFIATLDAKQKAKALFKFDSKERTNWHFIPMQDDKRQPTRKGLYLKAMSPAQKKAALELVRAGTSDKGSKQAVTIMSLEAILRDHEKKGRSVRDPEWYFFSIYGTPSKTGKWGWRVEGHHLSLNFTLEGGKIVSSTPSFFGANPAIVQGGDRKGYRTLPACETLAHKLANSLDPIQRKAAYRKEHFDEVKQATADPGVGAPTGLTYAEMNKKQQAILKQLLTAYTSRMPGDVGRMEMANVEKAGFDKIHFAFSGKMKQGQPSTYRVQGPTFVIEFLNTQPDPIGTRANHIHSVWRRVKGDFGV